MKDGQPVVLLTGANGFVGRHVAPALAQNGWVVRRAVRTPEGAPDEVAIESIGPATQWDKALAGVDAVVHLAARVHQRKEQQAASLYRDVNLDGTLHLARRAAALGARQFIFVSTVLVHGRSNAGRAPFRETDAPTPRGPYATSKADAEAGLKTLAQASEMSVTVIRPPLIYGPGAKGNFALLKRAIARGIPLPLANVHNRRAFLSVQNLTSFILHRLSHPQDPFHIFLVADDEQVSTSEFVERIARAARKPARLLYVPKPLLVALLKLSGRGEASDSLFGSMEVDLTEAASSGWRPPLTLDEGLRRAVHPSVG